MYRFSFSIFLFGCANSKEDNYTITQLTPDIVINTEHIDFGGITVPYDETQTFQIINAGNADLEVSSIQIEDNEDNVYVLSTTTALVPKDESLSIDVLFEPPTYLNYNRDLLISSNDDERPEIRIPITGEGVDGPVPSISLQPQAIDFGEIPQGQTATEYFTLKNVGSGPLEITSVDLEGSTEFEIVTGFNGSVYDLEQESTIIVNYTPTSEGGSNAQIKIGSKDPYNEETVVTLLGNGGGDFEYPVAVFNCPTQPDPPTTLTMDGSQSYDPNGNTPLLYDWDLLDQPEGSTTKIDDSDSATTPFFVDVAGLYTLSLTVQNSIGLDSEPVLCSFNAVPDESIHVELSWDTNNSDLDIHLVQQGSGDPDDNLFSLDGDCCWCNPNPSWGEFGTSDDPSLSLDNRLGYGPEAVHIESPYDGDYNIFVHYFSNNGGGATTATVKVYLDGQVVKTEAQQMNASRLWFVGFVRWENGGSTYYSIEDNAQIFPGFEDPYFTALNRCE